MDPRSEFGWTVEPTDDGRVRVSFQTSLGPFAHDASPRSALMLGIAICDLALWLGGNAEGDPGEPSEPREP